MIYLSNPTFEKLLDNIEYRNEEDSFNFDIHTFNKLLYLTVKVKEAQVVSIELEPQNGGNFWMGITEIQKEYIETLVNDTIEHNIEESLPDMERYGMSWRDFI